jgi:hypothetical protein
MTHQQIGGNHTKKGTVYLCSCGFSGRFIEFWHHIKTVMADA